METCAAAFDRAALQENCFGQTNNATEQMFIEVCLEEVAQGGDPAALADLYTVYCVAVTGESVTHAHQHNTGEGGSWLGGSRLSC